MLMKIFNRNFDYLNASFLDDIDSLKREGAIYSQFWQDESQDFRFCRIQFTPEEIVDYINASVAFDEFEKFYRLHQDPSIALSLISDQIIRKRVEEFNERTISIGQKDTAFCFAAFLGDHLENLICGHLPERYDFLSQTYTGDRRFILTEILEMFPASARHLSNRQSSRPPYKIEEEQDVRDLLYAMIKSVFPDTRIEEYTRKHAGVAKRIDIVVPKIFTVIEVKFVRDEQHAKTVADELKVDFESYHVHSHCKKLIAYIWDSSGHILDRSNFITDLRGLRVKGESRFSVDVLIKP